MKKYNKYKKLRNTFRIITVLFFIIVCIFSIKFTKKLLFSAAANTVIGTSDKVDGDPMSFLILGTDTDSVEADGARSDVMMVATFNPKNARNNVEVNMVSIPRDTLMLDMCSGDYKKATEIFNNGYTVNEDVTQGIECTEKSIENFLDIDINYHFESSFNGLIAIVDAIGGIKINVDKELTVADSKGLEDAILLEPGIQTLNGEQALGYARERKETNDYDRNRRQREVMTALTSKILSNPAQYADDLYKVYNEEVTSNLKFSKIKDLLSVGVDTFNTSLKNISNDKKIIVDKKSSAVEMDSMKYIPTFTNENYSQINKVDEDKYMQMYYDTPEMYKDNPLYNTIAAETKIERQFISKEKTEFPSSEEEKGTQQFGIEFQSYSMAVEQIDIPGVLFASYASPYSLNYTTNILKMSLEQPLEWNDNFNYNKLAEFGAPSSDIIYSADELTYDVDYSSIYSEYDINEVPEAEQKLIKELEKNQEQDPEYNVTNESEVY